MQIIIIVFVYFFFFSTNITIIILYSLYSSEVLKLFTDTTHFRKTPLLVAAHSLRTSGRVNLTLCSATTNTQKSILGI